MLKEIHSSPIHGVFTVNCTPFEDQRGSFARLYCEKTLSEILGDQKIVQINHSFTKAPGTIRGIHWQKSPSHEMKLIRCLKGSVYDVAVDLREDSPTYLKWFATELSEQNHKMVAIPAGCGHGFQVLSPNTELLYLHTDFYQPELEAGAKFNDPAFKIDWPLEDIQLSDRDKKHPAFVSG